MTIACLGWGSLIWDPRDLPIDGEWFEDGPLLALEFARESKDGRMTLVIVDHDVPVPTLWIPLKVETLEEAIDALATREKVEWKGSIGCWPSGRRSHRHCTAIGHWAENKGLSGVVWTDLKAGFRDDRGPAPTKREVVRHLQSLSADAWADATRYILSAPPQIDTPYRAVLQRVIKCSKPASSD